ncbi:MAG: L,D-transpeptidase family protein [Crocinitomicaceae bacterium]|nr:L,D-transpeptidase family protein [Crocinitomicaceae bacterium]
MAYRVKLILKLGLFSFFIFFSFNNYASFLDEQLQYKRVKTAYTEKKPIITERLSQMDLTLNNVNVMIKAYKYEQLVKVYVKKSSDKKWRVYKKYPFCWSSGDLGPKRQEGDYQIPEGYYHVNHFNPYSNFYLSLGVSYPNKSDKIKSTAAKKGGAIYMHGGCATIGCIPIEDEPIKEVYVLSVLAKNNGQAEIPIHIFPFKYKEDTFELLGRSYSEHIDFWTNIYKIERQFDSTMIAPKVGINASGDYYVMQ